MDGVPGVGPLLECGFILLDEEPPSPSSPTAAAPPAAGRAAAHPAGGLQVVPDLSPHGAMLADGWTPYLGVERMAREDNLLCTCDAGLTHGHFLPMVTLLQMAVQICDILQAAHSRNIVYRDHKLLHYYWQASQPGHLPDRLERGPPAPRAACPIRKGDGHRAVRGARPAPHPYRALAPGALPLGPTRPEEIEQAAHTYQTQWTYDDQRLSAGLRSILERVLAGEYASMAALRDNLKLMIMQLPDTRL